jgi:hypothetical protein
MGLAQLQRALARLYTEADIRAELKRDRAAFAQRFQLSADETESLAGNVLSEAESFARSLYQKRFGEAMRAAPVLSELLGPPLDELFALYATVTPLGAARNPALDTLGFIRWLLDGKGNRLGLSVIDGLRHEEGRLEMIHSHRRFAIRWVRVSGRASASRSLVIWWRGAGKRLRLWVIG